MNCPQNCGCKVKISRNKEDVHILFKVVGCIRNWVIFGMSTIVLNLVLFIVKWKMGG